MKRTILLATGIAFFTLWGLLCQLMLMAWAYGGFDLSVYGACSLGVCGYGVLTLGFSAVTFWKKSQIREKILWVLYIPLPIAIFVMLELLF